MYMEMEEILEEIAQKDFNKVFFTTKAIEEEEFRDFIVDNMINHPKIMVYYHCFYILENASEIKPKSFYKYWDKFASLLNHSNSYHRNFGIVLIANLAVIDSSDKLSKNIEKILALLKDKKFMTAEVCIKNCDKLIKAKPSLQNKILMEMMSIEKNSLYKEKQIALAIGYIINTIESVFDIIKEKEKIITFAKRHSSSSSPKTKIIIKNFLRKNEG